MSDGLTHVREFIARGAIAQAGVDAAVAGACFGLTKRKLLDAAAAIAAGDRAAAPVYVGEALAELDALGRALRDHFERLGARSRELAKVGE